VRRSEWLLPPASLRERRRMTRAVPERVELAPSRGWRQWGKRSMPHSTSSRFGTVWPACGHERDLTDGCVLMMAEPWAC
jgi:hypothetical protein